MGTQARAPALQGLLVPGIFFHNRRAPCSQQLNEQQLGWMSTSSSKPMVSAIVLAAGESRRMGRPKQLVRLGERTLLDLALDNVRKSSVEEIILVLGSSAVEIQQQVSTQGVKIVVNSAYQEGMASSLRAGIGALDPRSQAALIVLADQPCIRPTTLNRLIEHHRSTRPQIIIPTYKGFHGNPVLLDCSVFLEVMEIRGDIGCRAIFGSHTENISTLEVDDPGILLDVDTSADFESFLASGDESLPNVDLEIRSDAGITAGTSAPRFAGRPELVVVGRDDTATALMTLGRLLHFTTTLVDPLVRLEDLAEADRVLHRLDFSLLDPNPERYFVVASRGQFDEDALEQALRADGAYVGLVAGSKRRQELAAALERKGIAKERLEPVRASAGLEIGAETPEEIALSIMAEIVAKRRGQARAKS
jgi:molybdenum cofactor cytidylyltransferase